MDTSLVWQATELLMAFSEVLQKLVYNSLHH